VFVLAIDTSSPAVTTGVVTVGPELALAAARAPIAARGHGELLAPGIDACLHEVGIAPRQVGAVVVGTGPGPYTSLRVGLVTAAAFADALGIPAYGVCSLDAIADACADEPSLLVATDARRREVYFARYSFGRRDGHVGVDRPDAVRTDGLAAVAGTTLYDWPGLRRRPQENPEPLALVRLARERIESGALAEPLVPLYLRRPDAVVPGAPKTVSQ
jgi:tRNA threonylcarbamoyl adenosine modification protein YeaZ